MRCAVNQNQLATHFPYAVLYFCDFVVVFFLLFFECCCYRASVACNSTFMHSITNYFMCFLRSSKSSIFLIFFQSSFDRTLKCRFRKLSILFTLFCFPFIYYSSKKSLQFLQKNMLWLIYCPILTMFYVFSSIFSISQVIFNFFHHVLHRNYSWK